MQRFPWVLTVLSAVAFAILITLGVWQVQRLQWKEGLIARAEVAAAQPPADLEGLIAGLSEFRTVTLTCTGLDKAPYVELQSIEDGQPGVRLISLCQTAPFSMGGEIHVFRYLVDRGFVSETVSARPTQEGSAREVEITAQVRNPPPPGPMALPPNGRRFYSRDAQAMVDVLVADRPPMTPADRLGSPRIEPMLFALTSSNPEWAALRPSAPPAAFANNHLGYAITWFGLALALAGVYIALLRRKLAGGPEKNPS